MSKKVKSQKRKESPKGRSSKGINILSVVLSISIVLNIVFTFFTFFSGKQAGQDIYFAIGKGAFTATGFATLKDDEDPSFSIKIAQLFDNKTQRMYGYVALFNIVNFPDCSVIVDVDAKVVSLGLLKPLYIGGSEQELGIYFSKFNGFGIQALVGNEGIFKPDDSNLEIFADRFKDSFIKTMKLLFIKVNGRAEFDKLYPNGISLAAVGDRLKTFLATDINGNKLDISSLKGRKSAIIYVDPGCGSCKSKCGTLRDILKPLSVNVIFVAQGSKEDAESFIKDYLKGEPLVIDEDNKVANTLYLGEPPYLMLIDKDLTIKFKGHTNDIALDAEPAINEFTK
jgi:peroxiredoxin